MAEQVTKSLSDLEAEHRALYAEFQRDHMARYQEVAKRVLDLQIEIFKRRLLCLTVTNEQMGNLKVLALVCSISARETVAALEQVFARIEKEQIKVAQVIYDPRTFTFHIYSTAE